MHFTVLSLIATLFLSNALALPTSNRSLSVGDESLSSEGQSRHDDSGKGIGHALYEAGKQAVEKVWKRDAVFEVGPARTKYEEAAAEAAKALIHLNAVRAKALKQLKDAGIDGEANSLKKRWEIDPKDPWHLGLEEAVEEAQEEMLESEAVRKHVADVRAEYLAGHLINEAYWKSVKKLNVSEAEAMAAIKRTGMTPAQVQDIHKRDVKIMEDGLHYTKFNFAKMGMTEEAIDLAYEADYLLDHARELQSKYGSKDWGKPGTLGPNALRLAITRYLDVLKKAHKAAKNALVGFSKIDHPRPQFEKDPVVPSEGKKLHKRDDVTPAELTKAMKEYDKEQEEADNAAQALVEAKLKADKEIWEEDHPKVKPKRNPPSGSCNIWWCSI